MENMYSDKELIGKVLKGNQQAFTLLVKKYERLVYHIVNRMVPDSELTRDICQEVFIKVFLKLEDFKFDAKLSTWIATIAYRNSLNHLKKEKIKGAAHQENLITFEKGYLLTPLEELERKDLQKYIQQLIMHLPIQYRTVITLFHLNEFNYKEIYQITGWPEGTVKSYLFRARKLLKKMLEKRFGEIGSRELKSQE